MKKFKILIPVFNDWQSLIKLLNEIDSVLGKIEENCEFSCLIINDASTSKIPDIKLSKNITSIEIINMKINKGHARCNAFGLRYLSEKSNSDYVILMDGDGEDRPSEIRSLVTKIFSNPNTSVVAERIKRSEGLLFKTLYELHKIIVLIFTGKNIKFGNYSCLTSLDVKILSDKKSLWSSFSGTVRKYIKNLNSIESIRGKRYYGPSQMSFFNLIIHSLSILAVFKIEVFLRSAIILILTSYLTLKFYSIGLLIIIILVIFNLVIYLVSLREKKESLLNSHLDVESKNIITQQ